MPEEPPGGSGVSSGRVDLMCFAGELRGAGLLCLCTSFIEFRVSTVVEEAAENLVSSGHPHVLL